MDISHDNLGQNPVRRIPLEVKGGEHLGCIGMTQTGKTTAQLRLLNQLTERDIIIIDTKHHIEIPGVPRIKDAKAVLRVPKRRRWQVIYRPQTAKTPDGFYRRLWQLYGSPKRKNLTLCIDEAGNETTASSIDHSLALLMQAGINNGIGVWWTSQQAVRIHNTMLSQTEYLLLFRDNIDSDRQKLAKAYGKGALLAGGLQKADREQGIGGEFIPFGWPEHEPIVVGNQVEFTAMRAQ